MFSLTVAMGTAAWTLLFKSKETAQAARDKLIVHPTEPVNSAFGYNAGSCVMLIDDFGQEAGIWPSRISGFLFEDMEQSKHAHIARSLHHTRTEILGRQQAGSDPVIQQGVRGPSVISPMGGNGRML